MRRALRIWFREHGDTVLRCGWRMSPFLITGIILSLHGCGALRHTPTVTLTVEQLRDLEQCVLQDDQVERQNCVERLMPKGAR